MACKINKLIESKFLSIWFVRFKKMRKMIEKKEEIKNKIIKLCLDRFKKLLHSSIFILFYFFQQ